MRLRKTTPILSTLSPKEGIETSIIIKDCDESNPDPLPATQESGLLAASTGGTVSGQLPGGSVFEPVSYID